MARLIGAHTIDNGGIDKAALRAHRGGMTALQIFTTIPKFYGDKASIRPERVERFRRALEQTKIKPANVVAHAAYVLNVATSDEERWGRASAGLTKELERSTALGIGAVCFHPGAAPAAERKTALKRVAMAITQAIKAVKGRTRLLIENTAGAGQTIGRSAEEVGEILKSVPVALRERTGYGLDTCHLFASGYDLRESREALAAILDEFEESAKEKPSFFHLNDSAGLLGSNLDRHVLIGSGHIGSEPFRWLMKDKRSKDVPLILETPQKLYDVADDDTTPDPYDLEMVRLLKSFARTK